MAKRADSRYVSGGRTDNWLKIKTSKRQEVVIAGFTAPRRTRPFFGALALALREKDGWRYIGHVGTGFSHKTLEELHGKLMKLKSAKSPFPAKVKDEAVTTWVKPSLVAEVKFTEWTSSGEMRHPYIWDFEPTSELKTLRASAKNLVSDVGRNTKEFDCCKDQGADGGLGGSAPGGKCSRAPQCSTGLPFSTRQMSIT